MPLVKLGYLFIRTVAKPIASAIRTHAREHPKFRAFFTSIAQSYHRLEVRLRRRIISGPKNGETLIMHEIKPLDEQKAIDVGANFVGEALVFLVAGSVLVADQLQSRAREQVRRDFIEHRFEELFVETQKLKEKFEALEKKQLLLKEVK